ncbi:MAG TPA: hypothetical protein VK966_04945 [Longimicrobiales bacterium]|nr:hypothetical protein [Longimicrobiales bacterium]
MTDPRRLIPSVDRLLEAPPFRELVEGSGRARVVACLREVQDRVRQGITDRPDDEPVPSDPAWYAAEVEALMAARARSSVRRVINATGVILHTNLGRAPLAAAAREAMGEAAGYAALEVDLESGGRGSRHDHCTGLLRELTGAPAALVVNNNAAAVLLALNRLNY